MNTKKKAKKRLDNAMVEKGIEFDIIKARARILSGEVIVDDHRIDKPGHLIRDDALIRFKKTDLLYVSRGGLKLEAAIKNWPGPIENAVCIDVGSSTGGFTDVLLKQGAKTVFAVDVGYNQLAFSLRKDPRVQVFERTHIARVPVGTFSPPPTIAVVDVSFISLESVLPKLLLHLFENAYIYILIKPQFEVEKKLIEKGGIVCNLEARVESRDRILNFTKNLGFELLGFSESPITGADGNVEYIAAFQR